MARVVLLDSGPLGLVTHPRADPAIVAWLAGLRHAGVIVRVPEIADFEVRRELLRAGRTTGIARLDALGAGLGVLPVTRAVWLRAAEFWAEARRRGQPTAADRVLDADVILAALAAVAAVGGDTVAVATTNVGHLGRFVDARPWQTVS